LLIDLHVHTIERSDDSTASAVDLARTAREAGLDAIALTDHDTFWPDDEVKRISDEAGILVLAGVEINTDGGHALVFGLNEYIFGMHRPAFLREQVDRVNGAMLMAHPYRRSLPFGVDPGTQGYNEALKRATKGEFIRVVDGAEVINGRATEDQNEFARLLLEAVGTPTLANSDTHSVEGIGYVATEFEREITDVPGLIVELQTARFRPWTAPGWVATGMTPVKPPNRP
jgi:histidinol phosphatase-like PHP family hydrolase